LRVWLRAEAGKAARNLLNRFQGRQPDDGK